MVFLSLLHILGYFPRNNIYGFDIWYEKDLSNNSHFSLSHNFVYEKDVM